MSKYIKKLAFLVGFAALLGSLLSPSLGMAGRLEERTMGRKIVIWKEGAREAIKNELLSRHGNRIKELSLVRGTVLQIDNLADFEALKNSADVLRIDDDPVAQIAVRSVVEDLRSSIEASARGLAARKIAPPQVLPWGIDRIDAEKVWPLGNAADPIKVGVLDTGISLFHPDLVANIKGGVNTISSRRSYNDDNGHGSHVAGVIAALNNTQGVIGGAPQADLYAIKALDASGSGYYSDIIEGLDWAITNHMQVVNMSLGGSTDYGPLHDAVVAARNAGILVVAAAGNSGGSVIYPAAYPEVLSVSATDSSDNLASWSSRGPEVDLAAPGVGIYSTYKGSGYATLSGTSMATPHVVASAALVLNSPIGVYDSNSNGRWDPSEVQQKLQDTASDLGSSGRDDLFGWGLVNSFADVQ
jgi:subtilisin family serine protease